MDNTITHLMLNHLPQILPIIGFILLLIGVFTPSEVVKRTSYSFFILGGILAILPYFFLGNSLLTDAFSSASLVLGIISAISLFASFKNPNFSKFAPLFVAGTSVFTLFFAQNSNTENTQNSVSKTSTNSPQTLENLVDANSGATRSNEKTAVVSEPIMANSAQEISQNSAVGTAPIDANSGATRSSKKQNYTATNNTETTPKLAKNISKIDANSGATRSYKKENKENGENYYAKNHHEKHENHEFEEEDDD